MSLGNDKPTADQLDIGKFYEFSDDKQTWKHGKLFDVVTFNKHLYETESNAYKYIRECPIAEFGKISEPKLKPRDGYVYLCAHEDSSGDSLLSYIAFNSGGWCVHDSSIQINVTEVIKEIGPE